MALGPRPGRTSRSAVSDPLRRAVKRALPPVGQPASDADGGDDHDPEKQLEATRTAFESVIDLDSDDELIIEPPPADT